LHKIIIIFYPLILDPEIMIYIKYSFLSYNTLFFTNIFKIKVNQIKQFYLSSNNSIEVELQFNWLSFNIPNILLFITTYYFSLFFKNLSYYFIYLSIFFKAFLTFYFNGKFAINSIFYFYYSYCSFCILFIFTWTCLITLFHSF
jgi:hypothetical protein